MSSQATSCVWQQSAAPSVKLVLLALADVADEQGRCELHLPVLAARSGLTIDSVRRVLVAAEQHGWLTITTCTGAGDAAAPDRCYLNMVCSAQQPDESQSAVISTEHNTKVVGLHWPHQLSVSNRMIFFSLLSDLPSAEAQLLLDELTAALDSGHVIKTTPLRWFAAIVRRYRNGAFTPGAGLAVAARRAATPAPSLFSVTDRAEAKAQLARLKTLLHPATAISSTSEGTPS